MIGLRLFIALAVVSVALSMPRKNLPEVLRATLAGAKTESNSIEAEPEEKPLGDEEVYYFERVEDPNGSELDEHAIYEVVDDIMPMKGRSAEAALSLSAR